MLIAPSIQFMLHLAIYKTTVGCIVCKMPELTSLSAFVRNTFLGFTKNPASSLHGQPISKQDGALVPAGLHHELQINALNFLCHSMIYYWQTGVLVKYNYQVLSRILIMAAHRWTSTFICCQNSTLKTKGALVGPVVSFQSNHF